jgi:TRAP-type C4-dicarboxylate transport system permease small subunit
VGKEVPPVLVETFSRNIRRVDNFFGIVAEGIVFLLMLLVVAEIIGRHFFNSPIPGQLEAGSLSMVLILYFGLAYGQLLRNHIRVDLFISRVKGRKRELLEALALFLCLVVSSLMLWATAIQALISVEGREFVSGVISFPVWPGRCVVTFGFAILSLTLIIQICEHLMAAFGANQRKKES